MEAGDLIYLTNGLMKLGEGLAQILSEGEKIGRASPSYSHNRLTGIVMKDIVKT